MESRELTPEELEKKKKKEEKSWTNDAVELEMDMIASVVKSLRSLQSQLAPNERRQRRSMSSNSSSSDDLRMQVRSHEVALAELNGLSSSRAVYQRNGNIFFLTTIQKAASFEQKQLDAAKAKLQKLS